MNIKPSGLQVHNTPWCPTTVSEVQFHSPTESWAWRKQRWWSKSGPGLCPTVRSLRSQSLLEWSGTVWNCTGRQKVRESKSLLQENNQLWGGNSNSALCGATASCKPALRLSFLTCRLGRCWSRWAVCQTPGTPAVRMPGTQWRTWWQIPAGL